MPENDPQFPPLTEAEKNLPEEPAAKTKAATDDAATWDDLEGLMLGFISDSPE